MGAVPGRCDGTEELLDGNALVALQRRLLGGEVDGCLDTVDAVQRLLDASRTRRARHALEIEPNLVGENLVHTP